jgi:hypothetical protein
VLPGARGARVVARVGSRNRGVSVSQTWLGVQIDLGHDTDVDGRRVAICGGALNNYLVVRTCPGEPLSAFSLRDALALWRRFDMDLAPLLSRIAVVDSNDRADLDVKFFTCGTREHPSAPSTGLAVLAYAARTFDWLPRSLTTVRTPRGTVRVPRVRIAREGSADVQFPEVLVTFGDAPDSPNPD